MGKPDQDSACGGGSPEGERRRRRVRPWGAIFRSVGSARWCCVCCSRGGLDTVSRAVGITAARAS